mmetsp:Transcript_9886/g.14352  ORF Transcript_9886/g.14352 Transcript_9886/m.14352 type:complete len:154 (-) Transcript_9886:186-647(-)
MKNGFLTLQQKIDIVKQAYAKEGRVKATAKAYGVTTRTIYRWKELVDENGRPKVPKGMIQKRTRRSSQKLRPEYEEVLMKAYENAKESKKSLNRIQFQRALLEAFPDLNTPESRKHLKTIVESFCKRHEVKLARTPRVKHNALGVPNRASQLL